MPPPQSGSNADGTNNTCKSMPLSDIIQERVKATLSKMSKTKREILFNPRKLSLALGSLSTVAALTTMYITPATIGTTYGENALFLQMACSADSVYHELTGKSVLEKCFQGFVHIIDTYEKKETADGQKQNIPTPTTDKLLSNGKKIVVKNSLKYLAAQAALWGGYWSESSSDSSQGFPGFLVYLIGNPSIHLNAAIALAYFFQGLERGFVDLRDGTSFKNFYNGILGVSCECALKGLCSLGVIGEGTATWLKTISSRYKMA